MTRTGSPIKSHLTQSILFSSSPTSAMRLIASQHAATATLMPIFAARASRTSALPLLRAASFRTSAVSLSVTSYTKPSLPINCKFGGLNLTLIRPHTRLFEVGINFVPTQNAYIIERFGKFHSILDAGKVLVSILLRRSQARQYRTELQYSNDRQNSLCAEHEGNSY